MTRKRRAFSESVGGGPFVGERECFQSDVGCYRKPGESDVGDVGKIEN